MSRATPDGRGGGAAMPDDDIAALFAAQADGVDVPADLDALIRASAREAVPASVRLSSAGPTGDAPVDAARAPVGRTRSGPPRWLAVAAVLVLAFALVPLVRQAPGPAGDVADGEPSGAARARTGPLEPSRESISEPEALVETTSATKRHAPPGRRAGPGTADLGTAADTTLESEPEPSAPPGPERSRPTPPDASAERRSFAVAPPDAVQAPAADGVVGPPLDPFEGHRDEPARWLERLRARLRADGLTPALRAEYRRFRARYPDVEPAFDPAAVAREGEADRR